MGKHNNGHPRKKKRDRRVYNPVTGTKSGHAFYMWSRRHNTGYGRSSFKGTGRSTGYHRGKK